MKADLTKNNCNIPETLKVPKSKIQSKANIRKLFEREKELEAQNQEVNRQLMSGRDQNARSERFRLQNIDQGQMENLPPITQGFKIQSGLLIEPTKIQYTQPSPNRSLASTQNISRMLPLKNISSKVKQTIISSLQINKQETLEGIRASNEKAINFAETLMPITSTSKQTFHFNEDIYHKGFRGNSGDSIKLLRSVDIRPSNFAEVKKMAESQVREELVLPPLKSSQGPSEYKARKVGQNMASVENQRRSTNQYKSKSRVQGTNVMNPWQSIK